MRVAIYTRISTDEEHQPYSLEAQDLRLAAYVQSQDGWEVTRRYSDRMTGSTLERPELQRALADARLHRYDLLLVYRVDRLSRSVRGLAQILEDLDQASVLFRSATEPFDTGTPAGRMMVQMLGVFAEFERATLVDRVIAGMERKAARGGWLGGPVPYGYRYNGPGVIEPDVTEATVVRTIFDLYVNKRLGTRAVANWLNSHGHRTRLGRPWSQVTVFDVLRNPVQVGRIAFRGSSHEAQHEALIEPSLFEAAERLLAERGEVAWKRRSNGTEYLLSGLIRCGHCGNRYLGTVAHGRKAAYRYYTCFSRNRYGQHGCKADRLPADALDQAVLESMVATYADTDLVESAVRAARVKAEASAPSIRGELRSVDAAIQKGEESLARYFNAFEAGTLAVPTFAARIEAIEEKLAGLRRRREELAETIEAEAVHLPTPADLSDAEDAIREAMAGGTAGQRKALLQALVAEIRVESRHAIFPTYRLPAGPVRVMSGVVGLGEQNSNRLLEFVWRRFEL